MHNQSNPVKTTKKQYQKPDFWVLDSYVEGGYGANVIEITARTINGNASGQGQPGWNVHRSNQPSVLSASWTAAHS
ncbi:MAG: hypothetical protein JWQ79_2495 [Mucilaginibacter sp.]|jgi:hypothetical protein|nr:hypothetical protein [Mucilaginibacter sp.]